MFRDVSSCNTYNYGDALYWDARYVEEGGSFDWYQRYSSLRPFVRNYIPTSSRVLMVGCGNAVMSEDMVVDGYEDIMNVDISSVAIDMMKRKYEHIPQLKYMQMDVRDMSVFPDESFEGVIDKGTLDSLMCGNDAPISAAQMLGEVSRLLKPGGIYLLVGTGVTNALINARKAIDKSFAGEAEDVPILSTSVAYGVYMAVSSNLRYQVLAGVIEQRILEPLLHQHKIILSAICFAVRTGNTFLGSLMWVDYARWVGIQKIRD